VDTNQRLPLNQWSFIVLSYDGKKVRVDLNNKLVSEVNRSGRIITTNFPLGLGARYCCEMCSPNQIKELPK